jgi:hypothetical protein
MYYLCLNNGATYYSSVRLCTAVVARGSIAAFLATAAVQGCQILRDTMYQNEENYHNITYLMALNYAQWL